MENGRNGQAAQAEEKPEKRMEAMPAEQAEKPEAEKKPGYPMHKRRYTPLYTIIVFLYGILVKLLFFMKIEGRENVPKDRNCILMGNHQCLLDPVTLALCGVAWGLLAAADANFAALGQQVSDWWGRLLNNVRFIDQLMYILSLIHI